MTRGRCRVVCPHKNGYWEWLKNVSGRRPRWWRIALIACVLGGSTWVVEAAEQDQYGRLPIAFEENQGQATVKEVFRISRVGAIAGCIMTKGKIERGSQVRLIRDGKVVHTGKLESLKRFKDDVKEVVEGYECGIKIANHDDVRKNDVIQGYMIEKVARKLEKKQK